jgi:hypothetical protein
VAGYLVCCWCCAWIYFFGLWMSVCEKADEWIGMEMVGYGNGVLDWIG